MTVEPPPLETITKTIVERFHPKRVVLFGSRARGDADAESDVDLFVEMASPKPPRERVVEVSEVFGLREWSLDVFVYTPEETERLRNVNGSLVSLVEAEGTVLYEKE